MGQGRGSLSLACSETGHTGTWVDLVLDDTVFVVHSWVEMSVS